MKKWIFVVVALVLAAGLVVYFVAGAKGPAPALDEDEIFPKINKASSAPEIKYVPAAGAEGLEIEAKVIIDHWQRGILSLTVSVKNTRSSMLIQGQLRRAFIKESEIQKEHLIYVRGLKPGETRTFELEMLEFQNVSSIKRIEIFFEPGSIMWDAASFPVGEPEQINEEPEPTEQPSGIQVYTAAPKNPQTPGEVTAAFFFYFNKKEYAKAEALLSQEFAQAVRGVGGLEALYNEALRGRQLEKIKIEEAGEHESGARSSPQIGYAHVFFELQFKNGGSERVKTELIQESNGWKIEFIDFRDR